MRYPGPDYRFEAFHAIESIDDEDFLFNWSKTNPLAPLNKVFQPTNEQELRSIVLGGYETVRVVGSRLSFEPVHSVHGEAGPAALIDLRSWTGRVAVGEGFVTYKAATVVEQLYADFDRNGSHAAGLPRRHRHPDSRGGPGDRHPTVRDCANRAWAMRRFR